MIVNDGIAAALLPYGFVVPPGVEINGRLRFEKNTRVYFAGTKLNVCDIGAYSYIVNGTFHTTSIGRFCSIAHGAEVGFFNHPTEWVSSHPFQFMHYLPEPMQWPIPHSFEYGTKQTVIGNDVWVGAYARIMGGVTIGDGAVIAAGAVVTHDVEPYTIVGGVPAKPIKKRFSQALIDEMLALRWWDYDWPELLKTGSSGVRWDQPETAIKTMKAMIAKGDMAAYLLKENFNVVE